MKDQPKARGRPGSGARRKSLFANTGRMLRLSKASRQLCRTCSAEGRRGGGSQRSAGGRGLGSGRWRRPICAALPIARSTRDGHLAQRAIGRGCVAVPVVMPPRARDPVCARRELAAPSRPLRRDDFEAAGDGGAKGGPSLARTNGATMAQAAQEGPIQPHGVNREVRLVRHAVGLEIRSNHATSVAQRGYTSCRSSAGQGTHQRLQGRRKAATSEQSPIAQWPRPLTRLHPLCARGTRHTARS